MYRRVWDRAGGACGVGRHVWRQPTLAPGEDNRVAGPRRPVARPPCYCRRQLQLVQLVQARTSPAKMRGGQRFSPGAAVCPPASGRSSWHEA